MAQIIGNPWGEGLVGTSFADLIDALAGNDIVNANGGNDTVFGGEGERWNGMWWWWVLRGGKSGSMVGWGGGGAGEELRDEARAAPMMALERDSPVMCFVIAFTDSRW